MNRILQKLVNSHFEKCENNDDSSLVTIGRFRERLEKITQSELDALKEEMINDKETFREVINSFNDINNARQLEVFKNDMKLPGIKAANSIVDTLRKDGIVKVERFANNQDMSLLLQHVEGIERECGIDKNLRKSGFVQTKFAAEIMYDKQINWIITDYQLDDEDLNYGNIRNGSKGYRSATVNSLFRRNYFFECLMLGDTEDQAMERLNDLDKFNFFHPGTEFLVDSLLTTIIYSFYYNSTLTYPERTTIDWVLPGADYNHNGWHIDGIRPALKFFVLLEDVDLDTAPMYYAKGSHMISNNLELDLKHSLFVNESKNKSIRSGKRFGNNLVAARGVGHSGHVPDDLADNNSREVSEGLVDIGEARYEKFLMKGKKGDLFIFDSAGLHRGNFAKEKIRKTIVMTLNKKDTYLGSFLDKLDKTKF